MYRFHSSMVDCPHSIRGGPGFNSQTMQFNIWREVLGRNVYITSQYFFPAIIYRDIISHITRTYRYIMYFFRTFKKSTAPYKVHNIVPLIGVFWTQKYSYTPHNIPPPSPRSSFNQLTHSESHILITFFDDQPSLCSCYYGTT